ncbi:MAG TPA: glucans biosynthesis glucosyltransferase MdoH, partial [Ramlibacter sp.]|nr:glucans biosynthesis glucosyltransferase MdoH [Ramlibacter sp.]
MEQHHPSRVSAARAPQRSRLREERHPNSVTAPPLRRGSMPPRPWRGFWNSLGTAVLSGAHRLVPGGARGAPREAFEPWQHAAARRRLVFALLTLASTGLASWLFAQAQPDYGNEFLEWGQIALFAILSAWVVTGFVTALMGFWVSLFGDQASVSARAVQHHGIAAGARTAIVMPICNEDVATVFAGLRATCESVAGTGHAPV